MRPHAFRRGSLHGRIFWWFGATILATSVALFIVFRLVGDGPAWQRERGRVQTYVQNRLIEVWDDPAARRGFVHGLARDLDLDLEVVDLGGTRLEQAGTPGCRHHGINLRVAGKGMVRICADRHHWGAPWRLVAGLLLAATVVWAASGRIARRLARPIVHLSEVARDLGEGKLGSRARLDCRELGELGVLTTAMNDMAAKIERQMQEQRELLATVSHELRTPLGHVRLITELLEGHAPKERLAQLEREVVEMDRLVGELLAGARVDFSALTRSRLDLVVLAKEALARLALPETLLLREAEDLHVSGDATLLLRAITNLVENAQRHGGGLEALVLRERPGHLVVEARDRGPGFAAESLASAFAPFQKRGDDDRSLGLGLSLVRRIAEAHGGKAYVENRAEGGAVVGLELPR